MFLFHSHKQESVAGEFGRAITCHKFHKIFSTTVFFIYRVHCFVVVISDITAVISMKGLLG